MPLVGGLVAFLRPDLPRAELIQKYADGNSRFIKLSDGSEAHVELLGAAGKPTVILLHGAMSSVQSWAAWMPSLSMSFKRSLPLIFRGMASPAKPAPETTVGRGWLHSSTRSCGRLVRNT